MKKHKVKYKFFKGLFIILFVIFIALYFSEESGYYEFKNHKTKELTEKQIKKFEADVALGKQVDINDYMIIKNINYQNHISRAGLSISNTISYVVKKGLDGTFSFIIKLVEE